MVAALAVGGLCAWMLRGVYDRVFMMEGHFHIVSTAGSDHEVELGFPSGKRVSFHLRKGGSVDFGLADTGEGSIAVAVDGKARDQVGYVTSMNGIVVLVIGENETQFSQISPPCGGETGAVAAGTVPEGPAVAAKRFYRDHADFYSRDPVKIKGLVTPRFYAALEKEYACLGEGYVCAVEAAPWVSAQDGDIREPITFETAEESGGEAEVRMSYTYYLSETRNWPQTVTLKLERRPGDTTWRIGDLVPPGGGSLLRQIEDWQMKFNKGH